MIFKRFFDPRLAQTSYLIGCPATHEALVVDPNRRLERYMDTAREDELRITHVTETHIHADFVSGARELAAATGARLYLSALAGRTGNTATLPKRVRHWSRAETGSWLAAWSSECFTSLATRRSRGICQGGRTRHDQHTGWAGIHHLGRVTVTL
jgi:glyoxylase-like metal-dependent hydrolase (beta-lactamase superfamily II)